MKMLYKSPIWRRKQKHTVKFQYIVTVILLLGSSAIPAWAVVLLVGLGEILVGAIVFVVMKRTILDTPIVGSYSPTHTEEP